MMKKQNIGITAAILLAAAAVVLAVIGIGSPAAEPGVFGSQANVPVYFALGGGRLVVGNGGSIEVQSGGRVNALTGSILSISGTQYLTGTTTISGSYPLLATTSGKLYKAGATGTITGTAAYTSATTGLATSITAAGCTLNQAPTAGDGIYLCTATWSGTTLTVTLYTITPTASAIGGTASWWAYGTP